MFSTATVLLPYLTFHAPTRLHLPTATLPGLGGFARFGDPFSNTAPQAPPPVSAAPPISAYQGVRAAEPGRTIDRCHASAERVRSAQGASGARPRNAQRARVPALAELAPPTPTAVAAVPAVVDDAYQDFCVAFIPFVVSQYTYISRMVLLHTFIAACSLFC